LISATHGYSKSFLSLISDYTLMRILHGRSQYPVMVILVNLLFSGSACEMLDCDLTLLVYYRNIKNQYTDFNCIKYWIRCYSRNLMSFSFFFSTYWLSQARDKFSWAFWYILITYQHLSSRTIPYIFGIYAFVSSVDQYLA
jgi:hypothetical protein